MSTATFQRIPVEELLFGAKNGSVDFDWADSYDDELGQHRYEVWEYDRCPECQQLTDTSGICENEECERHGQQVKTLEGPMMNYYWPFDELTDFDPDEAAKKIVDLPLCVVQIDEETYGLALTGDGMDLSWEIAEAFTRIDLLPPPLRLPVMADKKLNERTRYIVTAMRRVHEHAIKMAQYELEELERVTERLHEQTR